MDDKLFDYVEVVNGSIGNIINSGASRNSKSTNEIAASLFEYTKGNKE